MIKIVVVDKQEDEVNRIQSILSREKDFEVLGFGRDGFDIITLVDRYKPDVAIIDINLELLEGSASVPSITSRSPDTSMIFFTTKDDEEFICKAVKGGVKGYLLKDTDSDLLIQAVKLVYKGSIFINPKIEAKIYNILASLLNSDKKSVNYKPFRKRDFILPKNFSKKEFQILISIGRGYSTKQIAEELRLSVGTVRNNISSLMQKLGLRNRNQLVLFAVERGLVAASLATEESIINRVSKK